MTTYSKIVGTGSYLPAKRVTNHELAAQLAEQGIETSDEWIVTRSGISARHYAEPTSSPATSPCRRRSAPWKRRACSPMTST
jgi:3-oxoacyl-[acyl-carrier-protein] synthase III